MHRDGHVEVERAYYAVPPEYLAREVWVRWDGRLVRIFNERMQQIAVHTKKEPGRFSTPPEYIASEKISGVERGAAWLLGRVATRLGPHSTAWAEAMIQARGVEGVRVLQGLLSLAGRHPASAIEQACEIALGYGAYHLRTIRALIKRQAPKQEVAAIRERSSHDPPHERVRPVRPRRISIPEHPAMNQAFLSRRGRIDLPDRRQQRCQPTFPGLPTVLRRDGTRAQLRPDKRVPPPAFAIASPGQVRVEAMAKAGGRRDLDS